MSPIVLCNILCSMNWSDAMRCEMARNLKRNSHLFATQQNHDTLLYLLIRVRVLFVHTSCAVKINHFTDYQHYKVQSTKFKVQRSSRINSKPVKQGSGTWDLRSILILISLKKRLKTAVFSHSEILKISIFWYLVEYSHEGNWEYLQIVSDCVIISKYCKESLQNSLCRCWSCCCC